MKKKNYFNIIIGVSILIVLWLWYVFMTNYWVDKDIINTSSWKLSKNNFIEDNYVQKYHYLNLRTKNLTEIPDICDLVKGTRYQDDIWSVDLADNQLTEINQDLSCLKNLSELNLSFNKIVKIDNLDKLNFIQKIDLWNNEITEINNLEKLRTLSDLHLWYNKITTTKWLDALRNLTSLKLQHNEINDLSYLKGLTNLVELKLEFNKLSEENLKDISWLKKLKIITVGENPWVKKDTIEKLNDFTRKNMKTQ